MGEEAEPGVEGIDEEEREGKEEGEVIFPVGVRRRAGAEKERQSRVLDRKL